MPKNTKCEIYTCFLFFFIFYYCVDFYSKKQNSCEKWVFLKNVRELRIRLAGKYHHFLRSPSNSQAKEKRAVIFALTAFSNLRTFYFLSVNIILTLLNLTFRSYRLQILDKECSSSIK